MHSLGPVISTHTGRFASGGYFWYISTLMVVFSGYAIVSAPFTGDWARAGSGVSGVALGLALMVYPAYKRFQTLVVHQEGFEWRRPLRAPLVLRWSEVARVHVTTEYNRRALHMKGTHVELEITRIGGGTVVLSNDLDGIEQVRGYLERAAAANSGGAAAPAAGAAAGASPWG